MYSITLQNAAGDNVISSGDILGRINFAVPSESDGGAATYIASQIYAQAEGSFTSASNPAALILATSSSDSAPATGRLKVASDGHLVPLASGTYDLGSLSFPFRNLYVDGGYVTAPTGVFDVISFNVDDESILTKGQISWDDTEGTMDIGLTDNTTIHIGEHRYFRIRNETGGTLYKGQVVYASGVHANGIIEPALYVADGTIREVRFMGFVLEDVNHQNNGYAIDFGHLEEMDLDGSATNYAVGDETWSAGDILYVHPTVAGKLTKNEPKHSISVAIILDVGNGNGNGRMFVRPTSYGHLDDNHDVAVSGATNGQFLQYNSATDYWVPSSSGNFTTLLVNGTPVPTGVGTSNYVTKWTGTNSIGNSVIYDNGTNVGIGTSSPQAKLDVSGVALFGTSAGSNTVYYDAGQGLDLVKSTDSTDGLHFGDKAYSASNVYQGIKHLGMTGPQDYMMISEGTNTLVSAKAGGNVYIRSGGNSATSQILLYLSEIVINENGSNCDFRVEGDTDANLLFVDASTERVGIGTNNPSEKLQIDGSIRLGTKKPDEFPLQTNGELILFSDATAQRAIACNGDGRKIAVCFRSGITGSIRISEDGGKTWATKYSTTTSSIEQKGSMSLDGKVIAFCFNKIVISVDGGETWTEHDPDVTSFVDYYGITVSRDGTLVVVSNHNGRIWFGTRALSEGFPGGGEGFDWDPRGSSIKRWNGVAISDDKQVVYAAASDVSAGGDHVYKSSDGGYTWTAITSSIDHYFGVDCSSNGQYVLISRANTVNSGILFTSSDSGVTLTQRNTSLNVPYRNVAVCSDGSRMVAVGYGGNVYYSSNYGVSWTSTSVFNSWWDCDITENGYKFVASTYAFSAFYNVISKDYSPEILIENSDYTLSAQKIGSQKIITENLHAGSAFVSQGLNVGTTSGNALVNIRADGCPADYGILNLENKNFTCTSSMIRMHGSLGSSPSDSVTWHFAINDTIMFKSLSIRTNVGGGEGGPEVTIDPSGLLYIAGDKSIFTNRYLSSTFNNTFNTASQPAYSWSGDEDNGMFRPTTNTVAFSTNGLERLRINSNGNVGIGTDSPTNKLTVIGTASFGTLARTPNNADAAGFYDRIEAGGGTQATKSYGSIWLYNSSNTQTHWFHSYPGTDNYINNGGNFGIGTATPQAKLDVNGTVQFDDLVRWEYPDKPVDTNIATLGYMRLYDEAGAYCGLGVSTSSFNIGASGAINVRTITNGVERSVIDTNGNFTFNEAGNNCDFRVEGDTDQNLLFVDASADKIGIGASQPSQKLDVNGRVKANLFVTQDPQSATNLPVGWYTIAVNIGNRAIGRFGLTCESGGRHQGIIFYASHYYGVGNQISILHNNRYSGFNPIAKLRIKEGGTYDGCLLQVYIDDFTNTPTVYLLNDNISTAGWNLVSWTADGTNPGGVSNFANLNNVAVEVDLDSTDFGTTGQSIFQGNVGIGVQSPFSKLHIRSEYGTTTPLLIDDSSQIAAGVGGAITFGGLYNSQGSYFDFAEIKSLRETANENNPSASLGFYTTNDFSILSEKMRIQSDGDVGIGTTMPGYKLDVNGTFSANSINVNDQFTFPTTDGSSGQALVTNGSGVVSWSDIASANLTRGSFEVTSTQSTFTVSGGYTLNTLSVYYNGVKLLLGTDFTATNGTTFTLTNAAVNGDIVEYWALNSASSAVGNTSTGSVSVTSNQTVFNVTNGYTVGGLIVFVNGVKLVDGVDFTATNGSSFTLTSAATSGDVVDYIAYGAVVASSNLQKTGDSMTGNLTVNADLLIGSGNSLTIGQGGSDSFTFPTGDGSANQIIETDGSGNLSWVNKPQVVTNVYTGKTTYSVATGGNLGTYIAVLNTSITPTKSSSKIRVELNITFEITHNTIFRLFRSINGGADTEVVRNDDGNYWSGWAIPGYDADSNSTPRTNHHIYIDSPNTTLPITYKFMIQSAGDSASTFYLNRSIGSAGSSLYENGISQVILTEIPQ